MPVEIKELLVKGIIEGSPASEKKASSPSTKEDESGALSYGIRKQIVDQCVQEVMDRIKKMNDF